MKPLIFPSFELKVPDEICFHPDQFEQVPEWFKESCAAQGVKICSFVYLAPFQVLGMGKGAKIIRPICEAKAKAQFQADVEGAMKENQAFLDLLKRNNLL